MAAPHRRNSSMMAMLDAKPEIKGGNVQDGQNGQNGENGQYWSDETDHLSPLRKHLISTCLQVTDEEAMPLLGEYFGVALSFVALGALVRASNSSKRKNIMMSEEEKLDIRSCSRFERMALESMLKESMERLGNLSKNAYESEARVRNLVDENKEIMEARDKEKAQLLKRIADAEKLAQELRVLRKAEGRANERVMSIVAAKEQDWLKEKRNLQKEIEKLKETVNGMTREAKFQARRCRNPTCEHCKGIDKVVKSVKGRISLRELHTLRQSSQAPGKREVVLKVGRQAELSKVERQEIEEDRVLMKAIELKKKQKEVEKLQSGGGSASGAIQSTSKEVLVKQQQDMESELANILKRVGMLKQKSYLSPPGGPSSTINEGLTATEEMPLSMDNNESLQQLEDGIASDRNLWDEKPEKASNVPEPNMHDPTLEVADCASDQEESALVELEKAFDLKDEEFIHLESMIAAEDVNTKAAELQRVARDAAGNDASTTNEQPQFDVDDEFVGLQERVSLEDGPVIPESGRESNEALEEATGKLAADISPRADPADLNGEAETSIPAEFLEDADAQEQELTQEATRPGRDGSGLDVEGINVAGSPESPSTEKNTVDGEQVWGVVDDDDTAEFADALCLPLDPVPCAESEETDSSAVLVSEQPEQEHTEYDSGMDVKENSWGFKDAVSSTQHQGLLENQDIPVFERNNSDDDLAGELPEPEEKRVCGLETLDSKELSSTAKEMSLQEGEGLKDKENSTVEDVGSQQKEEPFVEKIGSVADVKPKSDTVLAHSPDLEQADMIT